MKKLVLTSMAVVLGAVLAQAQGTISMQEGAGVVVTNGTSIGEGTGATHQGNAQFDYEVLDMTQSQWAGLSGPQQQAASQLFAGVGNANSAGLALWTDSTVSGVNAGNLTAGGITGLGGTGGTTAANWAAPANGTGYSSAPNYDYYTVVGWSVNEGTWAAVQASINSGTWAVVGAGGWFGQSAVLYNYAGGGSGSLAAPNVFSPAATTGLAGSGSSASNPQLSLLPVSSVPEPTTLALAGLGGISMLFLRRRKA